MLLEIGHNDDCKNDNNDGDDRNDSDGEGGGGGGAGEGVGNGLGSPESEGECEKMIMEILMKCQYAGGIAFERPAGQILSAEGRFCHLAKTLRDELVAKLQCYKVTWVCLSPEVDRSVARWRSSGFCRLRQNSVVWQRWQMAEYEFAIVTSLYRCWQSGNLSSLVRHFDRIFAIWQSDKATRI